VKTLDKAIEKLEFATRVSFGCVLAKNVEVDDLTDAIYYLNEFRGLLKMWNDKLDKEEENNPLTWEELKTMVGKPVWIEFTYHNTEEIYKYWTIVKYFDNDEGGETMITGTGIYHECVIGTDWQAYSKERK